MVPDFSRGIRMVGTSLKRFRLRWWVWLCLAGGTSGIGTLRGQSEPPRDGAHDFDWELGHWQTRLRRLVRPLSGSSEWVEYQGTTVVRSVWSGKANLVELEVTGGAGQLEGLALRLYNPGSRQWSLNYSNSRGGTLSPPYVGEFRDGRGVFYGTDDLAGRVILARFVITRPSPDIARFEQAFSDDGGATWEVNWIAEDRRVQAGGDKQ